MSNNKQTKKYEKSLQEVFMIIAIIWYLVNNVNVLTQYGIPVAAATLSSHPRGIGCLLKAIFKFIIKPYFKVIDKDYAK